MQRRAINILVLTAAAALLVSSAVLYAETSPAEARPLPGSVARQLRLTYRLKRRANGTLADSLRRNRQEWYAMAPRQRDEYRTDRMAFLNASDQRQRQLLKHYDDLSRLPANKRRLYRGRAAWLKVVMASFPQDNLQTLLDLSPDQRARTLLTRRQELISLGKLVIDGGG